MWSLEFDTEESGYSERGKRGAAKEDAGMGGSPGNCMRGCGSGFGLVKWRLRD